MRYIGVIFLFFIICIAAVYAGTPVAAVYGFESSAFDSKIVLGYTRILETSLFDRSIFKIVDRQSIDKLLEEQKLKESGNIDNENDIIQIGKLTGAEYIALGMIDSTPSGYIIAVKMVNVNTGMVEFSDNAVIENIVNADIEIKKMVSKINIDENGKILKDNVLPAAGKSDKPVEIIIEKDKLVLNIQNPQRNMSRYDKSLELDAVFLPKVAFIKRDAENRVTGNFGINASLGISWKKYFKPMEVKKFSEFWRTGTIAIIVPFVGVGGDYTFDNGCFVGGAIDFIAFLAPVPSVSMGVYF